MEIESDEEVTCPKCGHTFITTIIIDYEPEPLYNEGRM